MVSRGDLGIGWNEEFLGVAIFAGDVNEPMDLITLTDIPRNTSGAFGGVGELVLEDPLGAGLTFGGVTGGGDFTLDASSALELMFTLPSGTVPGIYSLEYTATVDDDEAGTVGNNVAVAASGADPDPDCSICSTDHPLDEPADPTPPSPTVAVAVDNRFGLMLLAMLLRLVGIHAHLGQPRCGSDIVTRGSSQSRAESFGLVKV